MTRTRLPLFWRVFVVNSVLFGAIAALLLFSPVEIHAPIKPTQAAIVLAGLVVTVAANAILLRRAFAPLGRLAQRMEMVDLLRPGQRLQVVRNDEVGRVVAAFNRMLDRLERERQESGRRVLAAQEAERVGIARDLHDELGQVLTGVLLQLNPIAEAAPEHRGELDQSRQAVRRALDEVRRISSELRPEMLEHLGLVSALTRALDLVRPRIRHPRRARLPCRAAEARSGDRARRLPHRPATSASDGATIRTAGSGRQPRSTSSIGACRS